MRKIIIMNVVALALISGMALLSGIASAQTCFPVDCGTPVGCRWVCR